MTATIPEGTGKLGPGTLTIGATGTPIDVSCLVNNASVTSEKDQGDATTKLCGTTRQGSISYTFTLSGNMDVDAGVDSGLFALSQEAKGTEQDFSFTPSTEMGTTASGTLIIDPLDFGADEYGGDLASDFEFAIVGEPLYTYPTVPAP